MNSAFDRQVEEQAFQKNAEDRIVPLLEQLPVEILRKLATGEAKIADLCGKDEGAMWLSKFEGTSLYDQALAIETQDLQREMMESQESAQRDQGYQLAREIRLQRKMLELQLAALEHEQLSGAAPAPNGGPPPPPPPPHPAPSGGLPGAATALPTPKPTPGAPPPPTAPLLKTAIPGGVLGGLFASTQGYQKGAPADRGVEGAIRGALGGEAGWQLGERGGEMLAKAVGSPSNPAIVIPAAALGGMMGYSVATHGVDQKQKPGALLEKLKGTFPITVVHREPHPEKKEAALRDEVAEYAKIGEELARADHQTLQLIDTGAQVGMDMAKRAFIGGLLAKAAPLAQKALASPLAGKAMNFAVKNPGVVAGGLVGAAGGLASGLRKDENGNRSLLGGLASGVGGAALGAGAGLGVQRLTGGR